eukprot:gnl/MRDRNA2_/MRDRNA2_55997_c0_seq2.p1 gnl/MRDRNA2_/MRDRNA2_55997_c0~~gnl/MRDRNA2_/MRDRNA2_55997_c0_seq2.p1  ORF type:complete len:289 (-),score=62.80 gnl/MRDRNA2_/MRDRNA2_55997_c0_seq2:5-871(-)
MKDEHVSGAFGIEGRYPFLDIDAVQEFLWLTPKVKNSLYKKPIHDYLQKANYPFTAGFKVGFHPGHKKNRNDPRLGDDEIKFIKGLGRPAISIPDLSQIEPPSSGASMQPASKHSQVTAAQIGTAPNKADSPQKKQESAPKPVEMVNKEPAPKAPKPLEVASQLDMQSKQIVSKTSEGSSRGLRSAGPQSGEDLDATIDFDFFQLPAFFWAQLAAGAVLPVIARLAMRHRNSSAKSGQRKDRAKGDGASHSALGAGSVGCFYVGVVFGLWVSAGAFMSLQHTQRPCKS